MKGVVAVTPDDEALAAVLASAWGVTVLHADCCVDTALYGWVLQGWVGLRCRAIAKKPLYLDFVAGPWVRRAAQLQTEPVLQAIGYKPGVHCTVWDATAGLGRESFLFAVAGLSVVSIERHPVLCALLENGLARLQAAGVIYDWTVWGGDCTQWMMKPRPDIIYLDPMFPLRTKSAVVKKEMQFVQQLVTLQDGSEETTLLQWALSVALRRVVVKRPLNADPIGRIKPSGYYQRGVYRWDVYSSKIAQ